MPEPALDELLAKNVDGYLLGDIESLVRVEAQGKDAGACGYPLLMTVFGGIELLGALSSPNGVQRFGRGGLFPALLDHVSVPF